MRKHLSKLLTTCYAALHLLLLVGASVEALAVETQDSARLAWVRYPISGESTSADAIKAVAVDNEGNIYVAGTSEGRTTSGDLLTIKYNTLGMKLWERRYDGPTQGFDAVQSLKLDSQGNVYVLGVSGRSDTTISDCAVIKYTASGLLQWVIQKPIRPVAFQLDNSSNIYLVGSPGDGVWDEQKLIMIKLNANGNEAWSVTYDDSTAEKEYPVAMDVDDSENVYVSGYTTMQWYWWGDQRPMHFFTLKYSPIGDLLWSEILGFGDSVQARVLDMKLDTHGQVIVTGTLNKFAQSSLPVHAQLTVAYGNNGSVRWQTTHSAGTGTIVRPSGMLTAADGSSYLLGDYNYNGQTRDSLYLIKLDSSGQMLWNRRLAGSNQHYFSSGALIQKNNNHLLALVGVYKRGGPPQTDSILIMRIDTSGFLQQLSSTNELHVSPAVPFDAAIGPEGELYLGGGDDERQNSDFKLVKLGSNGIPAWAIHENGQGDADGTLYDMKADSEGNLFVLGAIQNAATGFDILTAKYNPLGQLLWSNIYNSELNSQDFPAELAIDPFGDIVIAGRRRHQGTGSYLAIKYGSGGELQWVNELTDSLISYSKAIDLCVDHSGNIVLATSSGLVKYNSLGETLWHKSGEWYGVTVDARGKVYSSSVSTWTKLDSNGVEIWNQYGGIAPNATVDGSGNIYSVESGWYSGLAKYDSNGVRLWSKNVSGSSVLFDSYSNVHVRGDYGLAAKFNSNGDSLYYVRGDESLGGIALDAEGCLITAGSDWFQNGFSDRIVVKIDPAGTVKWRSHTLPTSREDYLVHALALGQDGAIYLAGETMISDITTLPTIWKYEQITVGVEENVQLPASYALSQNYPNPFNPSTTMSYELPVRSDVLLKIYNLLGQEVATLVNETQEPGFKTIQWNASGVASGMYFYRLEAGDFVETRKLVLLK